MCTECPAALAADVMTAFPSLVAHHRDLVYGVARRWTPAREDAEDLTQETFIRAYRALLDYPPERRETLRIRGWLASITLNLARNRARSRRPETADLAAIPEPPDEGTASPERQAERRESAQRWRGLLATLPAHHRAAVELRHVEGLSYPEIAEALDKPIGTVKSDVHRGLARLRRAYEAEGADAVQEKDPGPGRIRRISPAWGRTEQLGPIRIERKVMAR
ncbi:MAG: sigma-70 family RNA polymerase sigma factor [Chloroflexota bacterium]|nr:sigma-70 family RNA polymerase sigma factor [Chloroflexota bacterium]